MKLTDEQIEKAVAWWANVVQTPSFRTLSNKERGRTESKPAAMAEMMATMAHEQQSDDAIAKFEEALRRILREQEDVWGLDVDYHPDHILLQAAQEAGFVGLGGMTVFPWKTHMWFTDDGGVKVAKGYGTKPEQI